MPVIREYTTRKSCRVCNSTNLTPLFSLGDQFVNDFIDKDTDKNQYVAPLELELCNTCTLVQLKHTAPQELLYAGTYWYRSGVTQTMRDALRDITEKIESMIDLTPDDVVLDIGSNDGTLLRSYTKPCVKWGVEPATNLYEAGSQGIDYLFNDFWDADKCIKCQPLANDPDRPQPFRYQAKVVTAIGMFYDLEDPNKFIADVAKILAPDGLFIAQLMCLKNMVALNDVGNLCHEHLEYYSLKSLDHLLGSHGLEIFDIWTNQVNGESYRLFIRHKGANVKPLDSSNEIRIQAARAQETHLADPKFYEKFFQRMEDNKRKVVSFIEGVRRDGYKVWVFGASTKGNVLLQYYGLDHTIIGGASERSPEKWGKYTIGTMIPIYSEEDARAANPNYFLVLPYAFINEFIKREEKWIAGGGRFIVPLPEFRIMP